MSTIDERPALVAWVRAALRRLDETSGDRPWTDAGNDTKGGGNDERDQEADRLQPLRHG